MYLNSQSPILAGQEQNLARESECSDQRIAAMRRISATGRARVFQTMIEPAAVVASMGTGAGLDTARLQRQTETSRALGLLSGAPAKKSSAPDESREAIRKAPEVVPLNPGGACPTPGAARYLLPANAAPLMPQRAPAVVATPQGPLHFAGGLASPAAPAVKYDSIVSGLTGFAPPWSDAFVPDVAQNAAVNDMGVVSWISAHPWLSLAIAGAGILALSRSSGSSGRQW